MSGEDNQVEMDELEKILDYKFTNRHLLLPAITHSSLVTEKKTTYDRMEFLGDAVVSLVVSEYLYRAENNYSEGEMTEIKSKVVSRQSMMYAGRRLRLDEFLRVDSGLANSKSVAGSLTSDAYEAVVGAIYLDSGLEPAREFVLRTLGKELSEAEVDSALSGFKSIFQELLQMHCNQKPEYHIVESAGPPHDRWFKAEVFAQGVVRGEGWGKTKKTAEKNAAREAIKAMFPEKV